MSSSLRSFGVLFILREGRSFKKCWSRKSISPVDDEEDLEDVSLRHGFELKAFSGSDLAFVSIFWI